MIYFFIIFIKVRNPIKTRKNKKMYAIIGCGSIGMRHAKNLLKLGKEVLLVEQDLVKYSEIHDKYHNKKHVVGILNSLENFEFYTQHFCPGSKPTAAIICTPTDIRLEPIKKLIKFGFRKFFIEKPLAHDYKTAKKIVKLLQKHDAKAIMGFPWRQHPLIRKVKSLMPQIGTVYSANFIGGSPLDQWHPGTDYRKSYSAKAKGGGVTIDSTHEIDLALWLFGPANWTQLYKANLSHLQIESDDQFTMIIQHERGPRSLLCGDYFRRERRREIEIIGKNGIITSDAIKNKVVMSIPEKDLRIEWSMKDYDLNEMYLSQMSRFIKGRGASLEAGYNAVKAISNGE